jgi:hypothetical protein
MLAPVRLRTWPFAAALALAAPPLAGGCSSGGSTSAAATTSGGATCVPGASAACACVDGRMGAQQCQADGRSFGACLCVGTSASSGASGGGGASGSGGSASGGGGSGGTAIGDAVWAKSFGGTVSAQILSTVVDSTGAPIIAGIFGGPIQLGATQATCPGTGGQTCGFVAKLDADGGVSWASTFLGDGLSAFYETLVAVGPSDEVVVAGGFVGAVDFGQGPVGADGSGFVFLSRYDASGNLTSNLHYVDSGNGGYPSVNGLVVQSNDDAVLTGSAPGQVDFGGGAVSGTFLVHLQPNGVPTWTRGFANVVEDSGNNAIANTLLARTSAGDLVLGGETNGVADLGCGQLPSGQAFVATLDAGGTCRFQSAYHNVHLEAVTVDESDEVTVAGFLGGGSVTIGSDVLAQHGNSDALLFHLGAAGEELWGKNFGTSGQFTEGLGVCVEPSSGKIGLAGLATGPIDFGGGTLPGTGNAFAAVFESDGTFGWAGHFGDSTGATGCAFPASHRLVFVGTFSGTMGFPSRIIQANGSSSGFAAELAVP